MIVHEFFRITKDRTGKQYAAVKESNMQYSPACSLCKRIGDRQPPLSIAFTDNGPLGDFTWLAPDVFVSEKARTLLLQSGLTQHLFPPVVVTNGDASSIWHLNVLDRCSVHVKCDVQLLETCPECQKKVYSTWNLPLQVSDQCHTLSLFRFNEHPGMIFVSHALKQAIQEAQLSNIAFEPIEDVQDSLAWMRPRKE
jgi:hypothetical protein